MIDTFGQQAVLHIVVNLLFLVITWWSMQAIRFDVLLRDPEGLRAKLFMLVMTIAIAHLVSSFFLNYLNWSLMLRHFF